MLAKRILTAVVLIPMAVALTLLGSWPFLLAVLMLQGAALHEYATTVSRPGAELPQPLLLLIGTLLLLLPLGGQQLQPVLLPFAFTLFALLVVIEPREADHHIERLSLSVLGLVYICLPFSLLIALRELPQGGRLVLALLVTLWAVDSAAYLGGVRFGKRRLCPRLSPKKSVEGLLFGLAGAILALTALDTAWLKLFTPTGIALFAIIATVFGQCGDLLESCLKRRGGLKDSGHLIPGHGGVLDRLDSLIFTLPAAYAFFLLHGYLV